MSVIKAGVFHNCRKLEDITLHTGITKIGSDAFCGCESLKEIIPEGIKELCDCAFWNCTRIEKIHLSSTVERFFAGQICYCDSLKEIEVAKENKSFASIDGAIYSADLKKLIKFPPKKVCKEYSVKEGTLYIGEYAFQKNSSIEKINLPSSLRDIGTESFRECKCLKEIDIPMNVTSIGNEAFYGCNSLTKAYVPKTVRSDLHDCFSMYKDDFDIILK